jgi:hypothetical protein
MGGYLIKNVDKGLARGLVKAEIIVLSGFVILLTDLYDPYENLVE